MIWTCGLLPRSRRRLFTQTGRRSSGGDEHAPVTAAKIPEGMRYRPRLSRLRRHTNRQSSQRLSGAAKKTLLKWYLIMFLAIQWISSRPKPCWLGMLRQGTYIRNNMFALTLYHASQKCYKMLLVDKNVTRCYVTKMLQDVM